MPMLLSSRRKPVSLMIAALFPIIARELAKADDVPNIHWKLISPSLIGIAVRAHGMTWSACCRQAEPGTWLRHTLPIPVGFAKSYGGEEYLARVENDLDRLSDDGQRFCRSHD